MSEGNTASGKGWRLFCGDALITQSTLPEASVDAVVTDPPSGISFMGQSWDGDRGGRRFWIAWLAEVMGETLRVLKPGGHALVWALPRTSHWTATALEDAGFEVRDCVYHLFGSGFPKSANVSKQFDKAACAERQVIGKRHEKYKKKNGTTFGGNDPLAGHWNDETAPASDLARQWDGWGTALKPAAECWWLCRKPLEKGLTVAGNVAKWGTGALNVEACRVPGTAWQRSAGGKDGLATVYEGGQKRRIAQESAAAGRWPPNVVLSPDGARVLDEVSGVSTSAGGGMNRVPKTPTSFGGWDGYEKVQDCGKGDTGGASRFFPIFDTDPEADDLSDLTPFFYTAKPSASEKNEGCERLPSCPPVHGTGGQDGGLQVSNSKRALTNAHPTVKPVSLCRWLCRLVTPPGGTILDCFAGSGTTLVAAIQEGFNVIGIEQNAEFVSIAEARARRASEQLRLFCEAPASCDTTGTSKSGSQDRLPRSLFETLETGGLDI